MITFFKSQKDVAKALIVLIDKYWSSELSDTQLIEQLNDIFNKNIEKVYCDGKYTSNIIQRLGKRRIQLLDKILKISGDK